ncbi:MAG: class I SAM-dependent methyltransferase, partial [Bdellovibrionales bacterium]|nr:class I SAM-dependent methyltransferase [Bdellovibrionales bacterium]
PSIETNLNTWNAEDWTRFGEGENWSGPWGNTDALWFGDLLFRLQSFLPTQRILEIAPGHGRITRFLINYCEKLDVVDLSPNCIKYCQQRFADRTNINYHVTDGKSLAMVEDGAFDLIFSYASLVHVELDVIEAYLSQAAQKLTPNGVVFFHHSNLHEYMRQGLGYMPNNVLRELRINPGGGRGTTVEAEHVRKIADQNGLSVVTQELMCFQARCFGAEIYNDCFSTLTKKGSKFEREPMIFHTEQMLTQRAAQQKALGRAYTKTSFPQLIQQPWEKEQECQAEEYNSK